MGLPYVFLCVARGLVTFLSKMRKLDPNPSVVKKKWHVLQGTRPLKSEKLFHGSIVEGSKLHFGHGFRRFAPWQKSRAFTAGDQTRITADQLKARRKAKRQPQETWRIPKKTGRRMEKRWKVLPAGGTGRPPANIARNTVIATNISRKTPNSRRLPREILQLDSRGKGCKRYPFSQYLFPR